MNKRHWIAGSALIIAIAAGMYGITAGEKASAAPANQPVAPEVPVAEVVVRELAPSMELTGAIVAVERVQLRARVSGFVESVALPEGGMVARDSCCFSSTRNRSEWRSSAHAPSSRAHGRSPRWQMFDSSEATNSSRAP